MKNNIPVEGFSNLERDPESGAILANDKNNYENYLRLKKKRELDSVKIDTAISEINSIKSELSDLKNLLLSLVNKNGTI